MSISSLQIVRFTQSLRGLEKSFSLRSVNLSTVARRASSKAARVPHHSLSHRRINRLTQLSSSQRTWFRMSQELSPMSSSHSTVVPAPLQKTEADHDPDSRFKLTLATVNENLRKMEYAVRGKLLLEAKKINAAIKEVHV